MIPLLSVYLLTNFTKKNKGFEELFPWKINGFMFLDIFLKIFEIGGLTCFMEKVYISVNIGQKITQ